MSHFFTDEKLMSVQKPVDTRPFLEIFDPEDSHVYGIAENVALAINGLDMRVTYEASDSSLIHDISDLPHGEKEVVLGFLKHHRVGDDPAVAHNADLILRLLDQHQRDIEQ